MFGSVGVARFGCCFCSVTVTVAAVVVVVIVVVVVSDVVIVVSQQKKKLRHMHRSLVSEKYLKIELMRMWLV